MALSKITYTDKETLNPLPSVADKNKVKDSDMNEIKSVVNSAIDQIEANTIPQQATAPVSPSENDLWIDTDADTNIITVDNSVSTTSPNPISNQAITNYVNNLFECSTTEKAVGKWTDGRIIYEKSGTISIAGHNITIFQITNLDFVIHCQCCLKRTGDYHNINSFGKDSTDYGLVYIYQNDVVYDSSYTGTLYATIRYVKTS